MWCIRFALQLVSSIPTGFYGLLGNKGGVGIRLRVDQTQAYIVCSHLAPNKGNRQERDRAFYKSSC